MEQSKIIDTTETYQSSVHARIESLLNGFSLALWHQAKVEVVTPWTLDGILFSVFRHDEPVLEPFLSPICSNALNPILVLIVMFLRI